MRSSKTKTPWDNRLYPMSSVSTLSCGDRTQRWGRGGGSRTGEQWKPEAPQKAAPAADFWGFGQTTCGSAGTVFIESALSVLHLRFPLLHHPPIQSAQIIDPVRAYSTAHTRAHSFTHSVVVGSRLIQRQMAVTAAELLILKIKKKSWVPKKAEQRRWERGMRWCDGGGVGWGGQKRVVVQ